jgi:hypothetical protein
MHTYSSKFLDCLLSAGARGPVVDQALANVISSSCASLPLAKLLLEKGKADVSFDNGKSIQEAVKQGK